MSDEHLHHGLGFRPTEFFDVDAPPAEVAARLQAGLAREGERLETRWAGEHVLVSLAARERRFWSPWLSIALREGGGATAASTRVVAQFCPHPQLWSAVMLSNIGLASIFVLAAGFGWAQLTLHRPAWAFWVATAAAGAALGLWLGSHLARRLAREQMQRLWTTLLQAVETVDH